MKKAFTIIELVIVIFLLMLICYFIIPNTLTNTKQAQFVSSWKHFYNNLNYSISLHKINFDTEKILYSKKLFTNMHTIINPHKIVTDFTDKKYSYNFLSGAKVQKNSLYYINELKTFDNKIVGFKEIKEICDDKTPCALLFVDLNGVKKPNKIGKDIFFAEMYRTKATPRGEGMSQDIMKASCSSFGDGLFCSKYFLIGGKF